MYNSQDLAGDYRTTQPLRSCFFRPHKAVASFGLWRRYTRPSQIVYLDPLSSCRKFAKPSKVARQPIFRDAAHHGGHHAARLCQGTFNYQQHCQESIIWQAEEEEEEERERGGGGRADDKLTAVSGSPGSRDNHREPEPTSSAPMTTSPVRRRRFGDRERTKPGRWQREFQQVSKSPKRGKSALGTFLPAVCRRSLSSLNCFDDCGRVRSQSRDRREFAALPAFRPRLDGPRSASRRFEC